MRAPERRTMPPHAIPLAGHPRRARVHRMLAVVVTSLLLGACAARPPVDFRIDVPPGVTDARGRFTEIYCEVLRAHGPGLPDYRPCEAALSRIAAPPPGTGRPVDLGQLQRDLVVGVVPGIGYSCVAGWMQPDKVLLERMRSFGSELRMIDVDALSGTATNAARIRDAVMAMPLEPSPRLVLLGYSKGTPDILEALVRYPEVRERVAAVVSVAGAVGGSPIAEDASESLADLMRFFPGSECDAGDSDAVASLRPDVRRAWLADNPLPPGLRYYSVVTLPDPERISAALRPTYRKLAKTDPRNDGQVIYADQIVPGSTLLGFMNADHWAVALPIDRAHPVVGGTFVNHNDYPREAMLEAILRFVEEDLQ
jgi:hypothetical protein